MKTLLLTVSLLLAQPALAQSVLQACKDAQGAVRYENARTLKKNCERVSDESLSVIPSDRRKPKTPISIGMSQDHVLNNWGKPAKITRFETRAGSTEQWEYESGVLTFSQGVLEVIQY